MADAYLDAVCRELAEFAGLFKAAAGVDSEGQCVEPPDVGRLRFARRSIAMHRIRKRLAILEGRLR
jgi:hypothetical protein